MKKIFLLLHFILLSINSLLSQSIIEKEIFRLTYKGDADAYNFIYDSASNNYCYLYRMKEEDKVFIISNNSVSEKYDNVYADDIRFDSKGNYYVIASDFKKDYGIDNNFLLVNGKNVLNYNYIESFNSFINSNEDYVFIFKESDQYKIGYYNIDSGFRKSEGYELIKPVYNYNAAYQRNETESEGYHSQDFFLNENGERGFIAISNGKAKFIFETSEIPTNYSDINELSVLKNKNNELSFIAKDGAKFYEKVGNEFVVSGNNVYDKFELVITPLSFNETDEPVYIAGDSIGEFRFNYYPVIGNKKLTANSDNSPGAALKFNYGLSDFKIESGGDLSYLGAEEIIIPAKQTKPGETVYDEYYSKSFYIKNGKANELGFSVGPIKYNNKGDMLYSGIADLQKKEVLMMMNYGSSKIIINREKFDDFFEYGFTPDNEIYYAGQNYEDEEKNKKTETFIYIGNDLIGKYEYVTYQSSGGEGSIIKFGKKNNYAFAAEEKIDSNTFKSYVITKSGKLPFPSNTITGAKAFSFISEMMFTSDNKLFFIGDMNYDPVTYTGTKEVFVDNKSLGKTYNTISNVEYDESENVVSFTGSRGKAVYFVTVRL